MILEALHEAIIDKIRKDPTLLEIPIKNIEQWKKQNNFPQPYLDDWLAHFEKGQKHLFDFMLEPSQEGQRLRSSSPFAGILNQQERMEIFKRFSQYDEKTVRIFYKDGKYNI